MNALWPLAFITFKEGIRNRAMYGITIFALLLMVANYLISGMFMQELGKVSVDMALSAVTFSGLLLVFFVGINLISKDFDRKTIYMVLSRPISRPQYIWGKFMGMAMLIVSAMVIMSIFAAISIVMLKWTYPAYFARFSWMLVLLALALITLMLILVSALSFLFASFSSTSFIALILTILSYIIGTSIREVKALVEAPQAVGIQVSPVTLKVVKAAYYLFPNISLFDIKIQAAHGINLSASYLFWVITYGIGYIIITILLASFLFRRREFP